MRTLLIVIFALSSTVASAHGIKRITTQKCMSADSVSRVEIMWDSSFSILGPRTFSVNGVDVQRGGLRMEAGDDIKFDGMLVNGDTFSFISKEGKVNKTELVVNGETTIVTCKTKTKFRLF